MSTSRIVALAREIEANATELDGFLAKNNLSHPSFDEAGPLTLPSDIAATQEALSAALDELWWLNKGPIQTVTSKLFATSTGLRFILDYGIQNLVPFETGASFQEVADSIKLPVGKVRRILRFAMSDHLFCEPQPGLVKHTSATKALAVMPGLATWCEMAIRELGPARMQVLDALAKWPDSEEPQHTGWNVANNTDKAMFAFIEDYPERLRRFKGAMSFLQTMPGLTNTLVVKGFDWASLGQATIVDVGGSHGKVSRELAEEFPQLRCIVQDLPGVVKDAEAKGEVPAHLSDRVTFMAHSFFDEQPVKDASVYYFRWIFHDWSNKYCTKILKALIPALRPGAKVILSDKCLEDPGTLPMHQERFNRDSDMIMMAMHNAQERSQEEWIELFSGADSRFKLDRVERRPGSMLALIIFTWS